MVSKTIGGQLSCRFDPDLRQYKLIADLCSGSTADFESVCPGSSPGSAASNMKVDKPSELLGFRGIFFVEFLELLALCRPALVWRIKYREIIAYNVG